MTPPIEEWARAYLATQVIEVPVVAGWLRTRLPLPEALGVGILASTVTHPLLWYAWPVFEPKWLSLGLGEVLVWLVEGALYAAWLWRRGHPPGVGFGVALLANAASLTAGLLLW